MKFDVVAACLMSINYTHTAEVQAKAFYKQQKVEELRIRLFKVKKRQTNVCVMRIVYACNCTKWVFLKICLFLSKSFVVFARIAYICFQ